ncbi:MAG TPA: acyl-CoA dehydrogenase family protein [Solirubrobacterales bacterium]|nr:acyl-CoA dehydrogenase family protein [Solirubrobacterales bacterium]
MSVGTEAEAGAELARSLDESLAKILTTEALLAATAADRALDAAVLGTIRELGIDLVGLPEAAGGLGIGVGERARLAAVCGRRLVPAALRDGAFGLAPALAALAAAGEGGERVEALLAAAAAGELAGAVALAAEDGAPMAVVPAGATVLALLGAAEVALFELGDGVAVEPFLALDSGQGLARVDLADADPVATASGAAAATVRREYELTLICETFGAGERCLELAVSYAGQRKQFGQEIARFQAVAHQLAEAKLGVEIGRSGIGRYVDLTAEDEAGDAALDDHLGVLRHALPGFAREACETSIQVHGGIGFSWELGLHLFYRRILADQYLLGGEGRSAESVGAAYLERRSR